VIIVKAEDRASAQASPNWFTGPVWVDEIGSADQTSNVHILRVTFDPGSRTAWHSHPLGQTLHVLSGVGLVQLEGEAKQTLRPGDTVFIAPGERHWHGAASDRLFVHLAVQRVTDDGNEVTWFEHVTDAQYQA
jgi:quercetin dioxygenase-like cupin family protein